VQVQRHADGHAGCCSAHALEQVALAVGAVLGHHGAMQVEQDGVAARRRLDDVPGELIVGSGMHRAAGVGHGRHRRDQRGTQALRQVDEGRHGRAHAQVVAQGVLAV